MGEYLSTVPWWGWAGGVVVLGTMSRTIGNLLVIALLGGLALVAAGSFIALFNMVVPPVVNSYRDHLAKSVHYRGHDRPEYQNRVGPQFCPGYVNGSFIYRWKELDLVWCDKWMARQEAGK